MKLFYAFPGRPYNPDPMKPEELAARFFLYGRWFRSNKKSKTTQEVCGVGPKALSKYDKKYPPCIITTDELLNSKNLTSKLIHLQEEYRKKDLSRLLLPSRRQSKQWIAVLVHGFKGSIAQSTYTSRAKNLLLDNRNGPSYEMVIIVDWGPGATGTYPIACSNARLLGREIAYLLHMILQTMPKTSPNRIHLIGHSLGAHVLGYVGKNFTTEKIGRITGLDPAGPFFNNMPSSVRLDRDDAQLVDVIHTNSKPSPHFSLGISHSIGHMDFYPNGGHSQPGCMKINSKWSVGGYLQQKLLQIDACDHYKATKFFLRSIPRRTDLQRDDKWCKFFSANCNSWLDYVQDRCFAKQQCRRFLQKNQMSKLMDDDRCAQMGFFAYLHHPRDYENYRADFYLRTLEQEPFCRI